MKNTNTQFISEPLTPDPGTFDSAALARGEPGLPTGFTWRNQHYEIQSCIDSWKESVSHNHAPSGERYYRKRYFTIKLNTGETMTIYCLRHTAPTSKAAKQRWILYTIDPK